MRKLMQRFIAGVAGALMVIVLLGASDIMVDGNVEAAGLLFSADGVATAGSIQAGGMVESGSTGFKFPDGSIQSTAVASSALLATSGRVFNVSCVLANAESGKPCHGPDTVPAGKVLVVEFVSVDVAVVVAQPIPFVDFQALRSDGSSTYELAFVPLLPSGSRYGDDVYRSAIPVRAYLDEGERLSLAFYRDTAIGTAQAEARVSGYYVDKP